MFIAKDNMNIDALALTFTVDYRMNIYVLAHYSDLLFLPNPAVLA